MSLEKTTFIFVMLSFRAKRFKSQVAYVLDITDNC